MEHQNQKLKLTSKLNTNKSSKLDKNRKFLVYCSSRKENFMSGEILKFPKYSNVSSFPKFKKNKNSDEHNEKLKANSNVLTQRNGQKSEKSLKIRNELSKYEKELREFTKSTKDLEERYTKINSELNEMKLKHNYIITKRHLSCGDGDVCSDSGSTSTEYSLQRKVTQIFERSNSFIKILTSKQPIIEVNNKESMEDEDKISIANNHKNENAEQQDLQHSDDKENSGSFYVSSSCDNSLDNEYSALSCMTDNHSKAPSTDVSSLKKTITKLKNESDRFCSIIEKQKKALINYRLSFVKAKHLVNEQRTEIDKLNSKNQKLEKDAAHIVDELHSQIEIKLRDVEHLTDKMKGEQAKRNHIMKENYALKERIQVIETESKQLKIKLEEMGRRKMALVSRLKVAERDMKIFKNYNAALKEEKRKLNEELKAVSEQVNNMENTSKRTMNRQREQTEKQRRQLQKRIFELETKLNRSQNSSKSLLQERDTLIAELQNQLNNLVHNFEVSQKHIRVLRRHIYSICGSNDHQSSAIHGHLLR